MNIRTFILTNLVFAALPIMASAIQLDFPGNAALSGEKTINHGSYHMPVGTWNNGDQETNLVEGEVTQQAWKILTSSLTSLQILDPLKNQLSDAGFEIVYECETEACGGFDFRFQTDVMPEPMMHVDLGDFRFLAAKSTDEENPEYVSLFVSRSQNAGFVQLMRVGPPLEASELITSTKDPVLISAAHSDIPLERALEENGHFILADLDFQTGSSNLGEGEFASLTTLANYLIENPTRVVALVGHTDSQGTLAGNIALSKKRATSVLRRLVSEFGVDQSQISAEGNGFLSPRASNLTEDGRAQNRRVEVIVTSTQ